MLTARKYSSVSTQLWGALFLSVFSVTRKVTGMSQNIRNNETLKIDIKNRNIKNDPEIRRHNILGNTSKS